MDYRMNASLAASPGDREVTFTNNTARSMGLDAMVASIAHAPLSKAEKAQAKAKAQAAADARGPTTVPGCPRIKALRVWKQLPVHFIEALEQNQKLPSCCRHPENHDVEALKSHAAEEAPDIYIFHCTCGRKHTRFMLGASYRPQWA